MTPGWLADARWPLFRLYAWCSHCGRLRPADIGPDPLTPGRITEILRPHRNRSLLRRCPGSGTDADPL